VKRKARPVRRARGSVLSRLRLPPWLFYTLAALFALAAFGLLLFGMLHPQAAP